MEQILLAPQEISNERFEQAPHFLVIRREWMKFAPCTLFVSYEAARDRRS
jgi:hypothetical protein